ncbi:LacI family DNA-binding transcriptional regulator [Caballeronia cordobensis]|uniref:LacI family transcriptional regulator n=1 Tax=Caballeronia cordobensis TaxID=1353886 RepID=A0A158HJH0_CABCO|nr:substrate-binding domain-containing protein [Caballeronia cordobensis]BAO90060.1 LacI family transcription regulator [Burkholderia sp. RPE67]SAL44525.1 LacI family transcriptional regulator [Caballeronia cordobensis]
MNIQEFAAKLKLSVSTVSKALNGREDVSADTRKRVLEAAELHGFSPDPAARRLRRQSADTIAFVVSPPQTSFAHPFFLDMLMGVNDAMDNTGYQVIVASARSVETEIDLFKRLIERQRVDALLFGRTRREDERIAYLLERDIPFVAFGRSETSDAFPFVDIDHQVVGRAGCARFIALGHRRIALVHAPEYLMFSHLERTGYTEALRAAGIRFDKSLCIEADISEEGGAEAARRLLNLADPPTAIVCGHDLIALGALRGIAETGRRPGHDVGVIGGDNHPIGRYVQPALTTFSAETHRAGKRMAQMLLQRLEGASPQTLQEVWAPEMIIRASDGPHRTPARGKASASARARAVRA